jgi:DNA processing protein
MPGLNSRDSRYCLETMTSAPSPEPTETVAESAALYAVTGEALRAWLRLTNVQFSARLLTALLSHFHQNPEAIFAATDSELEEVPGFQARHLVRLRDPSYEATDRQASWIERHGVRLLRRDQPDYPSLLNDIPDPPPFLFVRGTLSASDQTAIGIVGSRHATPYGRATAERLARELAGHGLTVVSGGAVGIDAAAHRGAIEGGGRTLAFLGCGLDVDYPRDNRALFELIVARGAVISEYPLGAQPEAWRFPLRNRLISGVSQGVLVVEAPQQSGALITARCAEEQGRPVMAVPGNIDRPASAGCNDLLKDGAQFITETDDILRVLNLLPVSSRRAAQPALNLQWETEAETPTARSEEASKQPSPAATPSPRAISNHLPEHQQKLLEALSTTPQHIDAIAKEAAMSAMQAGVEMTLLELNGLVRRLPGNTYIRVL